MKSLIGEQFTYEIPEKYSYGVLPCNVQYRVCHKTTLNLKLHFHFQGKLAQSSVSEGKLVQPSVSGGKLVQPSVSERS